MLPVHCTINSFSRWETIRDTGVSEIQEHLQIKIVCMFFSFQKKSENVRLGESQQQVISSDTVQVQPKKKKASAVADAVNKNKGLEGRSVFEFGH